MASYEETLVNITLDAADDLAVDTSVTIRRQDAGGATPDGATANSGFQYRFVQVSGPHEADLYTGAAGERAVGVLQNKPQVPGHAATVAIHGISLVEADEAIDAGSGVGASAYGRATDGGDLGIAIHDAEAQGDLIPVLLRLSAAAVPAE